VAAFAATICMAAIPLVASAQVFLSFDIGTPPPPMPYAAYYSQPALTTPGEIWQPGYWAYGSDGYYWVPGTWVMPPSAGLYWTPGYWSNDNGYYGWNNGYWAPQVGFYGGVDYGYGYYGNGFVGGTWNNGAFAYNTAVTNVVPSAVPNVFVNRTIVNNTVVNRRIVTTSFNGRGGVIARPTARELAVMHERHVDATQAQVQHARIAAQDRDLRASVNHGRPATVAVSRPITSTRALRAAHTAVRAAHTAVSASHHAIRAAHTAVHAARTTRVTTQHRTAVHAQAAHRAATPTEARRMAPARASVSGHATSTTRRQQTSTRSSAQHQRPPAERPRPPSE